MIADACLRNKQSNLRTLERVQNVSCQNPSITHPKRHCPELSTLNKDFSISHSKVYILTRCVPEPAINMLPTPNILACSHANEGALPPLITQLFHQDSAANYPFLAGPHPHTPEPCCVMTSCCSLLNLSCGPRYSRLPKELLQQYPDTYRHTPSPHTGRRL